MTPTVYIVTQSLADDTRILAVYSNKDVADAHARRAEGAVEAFAVDGEQP